MSEKLIRFSNIISEFRWVKAIQRGLMLILPLLMIGSLVVLINNFPLKHYQEWMIRLFGPTWKDVGMSAWEGTFGVMAIILSVTVSYALATERNCEEMDRINPLLPSIVSFIAFMVIIYSSETSIFHDDAGATGIFLAIMTAIISTELLLKLNQMKFFHFSVPNTDADMMLPQALSMIIPSILTIAVFILIRIAALTFGVQDINALFKDFVVNAFQHLNNSFPSALLYGFTEHLLWFFGIHGGVVLEPIAQKIYVEASILNAHAVSLGQPPTEIFTKSFFDVFVLIGGAGATLSLLAAVFISARKSSTSGLARISIVPAVFNINEIVTFGFPIILNPLYLIPFLLVPLVLIFTTYIAMKTGLVPLTKVHVDWITPPILGGYLATGSWRGAALQVFNLGLGVLLYLPFIRLNEMYKEKRDKKTFEKLVHEAVLQEIPISSILNSGHKDTGNLVRILSKDIRRALKEGSFSLEYQPQINHSGRPIGVEALLRWNHRKYGKVPPVLIVSIAEATKQISDLGAWVLREACKTLKKWNQNGLSDIKMSINISPSQLYDEKLHFSLVSCVKEYGLNPSSVELEITESVSQGMDEVSLKAVSGLKKMGVSIAMDDFGMGYTSLLYMRHFNVDTIKLDGSLVRDVLKDKNCQDIISSVVYLCNSMQVKIIAEFVESEDQRNLLHSLGCREYQGYLFSPPLPDDQCFAYIREALK